MVFPGTKATCLMSELCAPTLRRTCTVHVQGQLCQVELQPWIGMLSKQPSKGCGRAVTGLIATVASSCSVAVFKLSLCIFELCCRSGLAWLCPSPVLTCWLTFLANLQTCFVTVGLLWWRQTVYDPGFYHWTCSSFPVWVAGTESLVSEGTAPACIVVTLNSQLTFPCGGGCPCCFLMLFSLLIQKQASLFPFSDRNKESKKLWALIHCWWRYLHFFSVPAGVTGVQTTMHKEFYGRVMNNLEKSEL